MSSKTSTPGLGGEPSRSGGRKRDPLKAKKDELYAKCLERFSTDVFNQTDLVALGVAKDLPELMILCQELATANMFQIMTLDGTLCYKVRQKDDASKLAGLGAKEYLIYSQIESTGVAGMWTKTLKARTNLHQTVLNRCIKTLEAASLIKQIKSIKFPGRKIYMLYELNPGEEVTGGPWFSEGELDVDFIDLIGGLITEYVKSNSWREGPKPPKSISARSKKQSQQVQPQQPSQQAQPQQPSQPDLETYPSSHPALSNRGRILVPHPPSYRDYPTATDILDWIDSKGVVQGKDLSLHDLTHLLDVLVFDGRLERMGKRRADASSHDASASESEEAPEDDNEEPMPDADDDDEDDDDENTRGKRSTKSRSRAKSKTKTPAPQDPGDMYRWVRVPGGEDIERGPGNGFSEAPCSKCPVFRLCEEGGPVDARSCGYFEDWLAV